jgi:hypothetical protein
VRARSGATVQRVIIPMEFARQLTQGWNKGRT